LVTHDHSDHNQIGRVTQKPGCLVVTAEQALAGGQYHAFQADGVRVQALPAANQHHPIDRCVGYLLTLDDVKVYCAGDTSTLPQMAELQEKKLDYALLPIDGIYNMDAAEAARCAELIGARHTIPIHTDPHDEDGICMSKVAAFCCDGRLVLQHGEEISLCAAR
ncbi:MAG: MBL fold metallo-hydrolase, partial [Oscillospiraceae bacterium]